MRWPRRSTHWSDLPDPTNGELPFENVLPTRPHSVNLLHCLSPFHCASSTSKIVSVSHPAGERRSHSIWLVVTIGNLGTETHSAASALAVILLTSKRSKQPSARR